MNRHAQQAAACAPPRFSNTDIDAVASSYVIWRMLRAVYEHDFTAGVAMYERMDELCALCKVFKNYRPGVVRGNMTCYLSCRRCPLVQCVGTTCARIRKDNGFSEDFYKDPATAEAGMNLSCIILKEILLYMQANRSAPRPCA